MALYFELAKLIKIYNNISCQQGSTEWHNLRKTRVGASEISTLLGINKYKTLRTLLMEKTVDVPQTRYIGAPAAFGKLFETVIRTHCENEYKTAIYESGPIISLPGQATSPDGISIVNIEIDGKIYKKIALWEFKCLYMRQPVYGTLPDYYKTQVLAGLETFPICSLAIFVETNIRLASLNIAGNIKYFNMSNPIWRRGVTMPVGNVICWGAISFVSMVYCIDKGDKTPGAASLSKLLDLYNTDGTIDFGSVGRDFYEYLLEVIVEDNKFIDINYIYQQENLPDGNGVDEYTKEMLYNAGQQHCADVNGKILLGLLRWKMIDKNEVIIYPQKGFLNTVYPQIQALNSGVAECNKLITLSEKLKKIDECTAKIIKLNSGTNSALLDFLSVIGGT